MSNQEVLRMFVDSKSLSSLGIHVFGSKGPNPTPLRHRHQGWTPKNVERRQEPGNK